MYSNSFEIGEMSKTIAAIFYKSYSSNYVTFQNV